MPRLTRRGGLPTALTRAASFALILLVLLPWTTPFATLDVDSSGSDRPAFDTPKAKAFEAAIVVVARWVAPDWLSSEIRVRPLIAAAHPPAAPHRLPLRI